MQKYPEKKKTGYRQLADPRRLCSRKDLLNSTEFEKFLKWFKGKFKRVQGQKNELKS